MAKIFRDSVWDRNNVMNGILKDIKIPKMARIRQIFDNKKLDNIPETVQSEINKPEFSNRIKRGQRIAITAGSRGVANIAQIMRELVRNLKALGAEPFLIPAMGSHGGATAEGQVRMLKSFGITEEFVGAPILATMEVEQVGNTVDGKPVYVDKNALAADGVIVVNRIKPHCSYRGRFESGLYKIMVIGLGKQRGAEIVHEDGFGKMAEYIPKFAEVIMENVNIVGGVAILENPYDETYLIEAIPTDQLDSREPELLLEAKKLMPEIRFDPFDVLVVDQIGKNISGDGMDANITGSFTTPYADGGADVQKYVVLDVTDASHGNVIGIGLANFTTKRLFDKTDFDTGYPNALTCTETHGVSMPMVLQSDDLALKAALYCCLGIDKTRPRIVRIKNTLSVEEIWISEPMIEEARQNVHIDILAEPRELTFNEDGNLF